MGNACLDTLCTLVPQVRAWNENSAEAASKITLERTGNEQGIGEVARPRLLRGAFHRLLLDGEEFVPAALHDDAEAGAVVRRLNADEAHGQKFMDELQQVSGRRQQGNGTLWGVDDGMGWSVVHGIVHHAEASMRPDWRFL